MDQGFILNGEREREREREREGEKERDAIDSTIAHRHNILNTSAIGNTMDHFLQQNT